MAPIAKAGIEGDIMEATGTNEDVCTSRQQSSSSNGIYGRSKQESKEQAH